MQIQIRIYLKETRMAAGLSIRQLAACSGISRSEISGIESGKITPTIYVIGCLSVALNSKLDDLVQIKCPS